MDRELIPSELKGNDTMEALLDANDAAEACYKLAALSEDMEQQQTGTKEQRRSCRQIALQAANVSFSCITVATYLFMSTVSVDIAEQQQRPQTEQLKEMQKEFISNAADARAMLNELARKANAFLDSMEQ